MTRTAPITGTKFLMSFRVPAPDEVADPKNGERPAPLPDLVHSSRPRPTSSADEPPTLFVHSSPRITRCETKDEVGGEVRTRVWKVTSSVGAGHPSHPIESSSRCFLPIVARRTTSSAPNLSPGTGAVPGANLLVPLGSGDACPAARPRGVDIALTTGSAAPSDLHRCGTRLTGSQVVQR